MVRDSPDFDLALVDVRLPGRLNGLELADVLKREFGHIPTVVYSGYPEMDDADQNRIEFPFLRKPFSRRELAVAVDAALRQSLQ